MRYKTEDGFIEEALITEEEKFILDHFRKGASITLFVNSETKDEAKKIRDTAPVSNIRDDNESAGYYSASQFIGNRRSLLTVLSRYKKSHSAAKQ